MLVRGECDDVGEPVIVEVAGGEPQIIRQEHRRAIGRTEIAGPVTEQRPYFVSAGFPKHQIRRSISIEITGVQIFPRVDEVGSVVGEAAGSLALEKGRPTVPAKAISDDKVQASIMVVVDGKNDAGIRDSRVVGSRSLMESSDAVPKKNFQ